MKGGEEIRPIRLPGGGGRRKESMEIITIETPALGDRSYLLVDGSAAAAVDPQRDIDRIEAMLAERCRSSARNPAWNCQPTQNCTGVVRAQSRNGSRNQ